MKCLGEDAMEGMTVTLVHARRHGLAQCGLIRCVCGYPYRPEAFEPAWLTSTIVASPGRFTTAEPSTGCRSSRAPSGMRAGCEDARIPGHYRGQEPHARGAGVSGRKFAEAFAPSAALPYAQPHRRPAMTVGSLPHFAARLTRLTEPAGGGTPDADLLRRFADAGDHTAFELLVWRYAGLVLGTCRRTLGRSADADDAKELTDWARTELGLVIEADQLVGRSRDDARSRLLNAYDAKYRPEMHAVERGLVLEQSDGAWKAHLLTMDSLRSGVGLRGYAQEDPKIIYKREGMREFDAMWAGVRDRVTEAVFRMEEMGDEDAQMALWAGARATQSAAISAAQSRAAEVDAQQQTTNTGGDGKKAEPIRNLGAKVGRNDPCPCGSGKKYKNCHMKTEARK